MRGSAYVKLRVWMVNRDGSINKKSASIEYGHSQVRDMNNTQQREENFQYAKNQALKQYRNKHQISSDTEINYHLLASGILSRTELDGKVRRKYYKNRISPQRKRELHKQSYLGKEKIVTLKDVKQMEKTEVEYTGSEKHPRIETEHYVIDTGNINVKKRTIRGYYGMNKPASKELGLKIEMKDNDILIAKSLKGRKKRQVIAHEIHERNLMKKGMHYKKAHKRALKFEKKVK